MNLQKFRDGSISKIFPLTNYTNDFLLRERLLEAMHDHQVQLGRELLDLQVGIGTGSGGTPKSKSGSPSPSGS